MYSPRDIASGLYQVQLIEGLQALEPAQFGVPAELTDKYNERRRLYTMALIYLVLQQFDSDPRGHAAAQEFTQMVSPTRDLSVMEKLQVAMKDLHEGPLTRRENPYLSWVLEWFKQIGFEISDPIPVVMFYMVWMEAWIATYDSMKKLLSAP
jgi:hypothetical protein